MHALLLFAQMIVYVNHIVSNRIEERMILESSFRLSRRICLEINRPTKVVLAVCCSTTYLTDELCISDAFAHLFDVVVFGVFAHVFFVISHLGHSK